MAEMAADVLVEKIIGWGVDVVFGVKYNLPIVVIIKNNSLGQIK